MMSMILEHIARYSIPRNTSSTISIDRTPALLHIHLPRIPKLQQLPAVRNILNVSQPEPFVLDWVSDANAKMCMFKTHAM